jgi:hypothetical protein
MRRQKDVSRMDSLRIRIHPLDDVLFTLSDGTSRTEVALGADG